MVGIAITKCGACGTLHARAASVCPSCHSADLSAHQASGSGQLLTWTVIHRPPKELVDIGPYAVGVVQLVEGVRVVGRIDTIDLNSGDSVICISVEGGVPIFAVAQPDVAQAAKNDALVI
jgi:uncharacterized OB-fold protein